MNSIPAAAIATMAAAIDDYRLTTPPDQQTPHGAAERAAEYLLTGGWGLYVPRGHRPPPPVRMACPHCGLPQLITQQQRIRRHGPQRQPCPGSGANTRTIPTA